MAGRWAARDGTRIRGSAGRDPGGTAGEHRRSCLSRPIPGGIERADPVIFIDYSLPQIYWWALKKEARYAFRPRPEMPAGTPEWKITWRLFKIIWKIHFEMRAEWLTLVAHAAETGKMVHHFRRPRETQLFLEGLA